MESTYKTYEQEKKIADAIDQLDNQRKSLRNLAKQFEDTAFEAAKMGQDEYANELLGTSVEIEEFASDLDFVSLQVTQTVKVAGAMADLYSLPKAIETCGNILNKKAPNFAVTAKAMAKVNAKSKKSLAELRRFREACKKNPTDTYAKLFGRDVKGDAKHNQLLEQKKKALELRMCQNVTTPTAVQTVDTPMNVTAEDVASIDRIATILDEEKRK